VERVVVIATNSMTHAERWFRLRAAVGREGQPAAATGWTRKAR
jgi:hypothetical protein